MPRIISQLTSSLFPCWIKCQSQTLVRSLQFDSLNLLLPITSPLTTSSARIDRKAFTEIPLPGHSLYPRLDISFATKAGSLSDKLTLPIPKLGLRVRWDRLLGKVQSVWVVKHDWMKDEDDERLKVNNLPYGLTSSGFVNYEQRERE